MHLANDQLVLAQLGVGREEHHAPVHGLAVADLVLAHDGELAVAAAHGPEAQHLEGGEVAGLVAVLAAADPGVGGGGEDEVFFVANRSVSVGHVLTPSDDTLQLRGQSLCLA